MKELKRYDAPICSHNLYDHIVDTGDSLWYIGVQIYSVDPRYTRSGSWEDHYISENLAKIENKRVVWISPNLPDISVQKINRRLSDYLK